MYYQLFEYSQERRKKFPQSKRYVLVFSDSEKVLHAGIKRLKKVDLAIKEVTGMQETAPKINESECVLFPGSQQDMEAYYKS